MRLVVPEKDSEWGGVKIEAGRQYVFEPRGSAAMLVKLDGLASVEPVSLPPYYPNEDYNHKTLTILRAGGIGDILMMTPLLKAMNERWPEAHLEVCCGERSRFALPSFVDWLPYPPPMRDIMERDSILNLTGVIEREFEEHGVRAFGNEAGFRDLPLRLLYEPDPSVVGDIRLKYPRKAKARVGIQVKASTKIRSYPYSGEVITLLLERGIEVVMFGEPHLIITDRPHPLITNASADGLDMEDSVALASLCDCLIAPDSSFIHFGCAMNVPTIGLFGSFSYSIRRTEGHPDNYFIEAKGECSPCNFHGEGGQSWPTHGPCKRSGFCNVLAGIPAERVARKAIQICKA